MRAHEMLKYFEVPTMSGTANLILSWLKKHPTIFRFREEQSIFLLEELATGKTLKLDANQISKHRLTPHPQNLGEYLNLVFENGTELVLCHAGIAFSPHFSSTGFLPDAPSVCCMGDYYTLLNSLKSLIKEARQKEALLLFNVLISVLDGARAIGIDIGPEEKELDILLTEFEDSPA